MSGAEVESIIELICDKIGIVVDSVTDAVPLFATRGLITNGIPMVLCLIYFTIAAVFLVMLVKTCLNFVRNNALDADDDWLYGLVLIGMVVIVIAFIIGWSFFSHIERFLGWLLAPQAEMFYEILRML